MPICPKCKKNIDYLLAVVKERNLYNYYGDGSFHDHRDSFENDTEYFKCPLCDAHFNFTDTDAADKFLGAETITVNYP